jgi:LPXTG-motif cell wall-anchored protein
MAAATTALTLMLAAGTAEATTLSLNLTADNQFSAYLSNSDSTLGTLIGSAGDWTTTASYATQLTGNTPYYLHVIATNWGGPDGFIGSFTLGDATYQFSNGLQSLSTNTVNWNAVAASDNVSWTVPTVLAQSYGTNGVGPWGTRPGIDPAAQWIWSNPDNGAYADLSTEISVSAVPLPAALPLFGAAMAGLAGLGLKKRRKAA